MSADTPRGDGESTARAYGGASPFSRADKPPLIHRAVPVTGRLKGYRGGSAGHDLLAGLTVAALALPSGMAYAELAGLSPVNGLYALLVPTVAYGLLGSSRQVIVGPEGSLTALVAASILGLAAAGSAEAAELAAMLALLVGALFGLARLARLGWIADYLSRPVLVGYIHGVAGVLIIGQLGKLLGLDIDAVDAIPQLVEAGREVGGVSGPTIAVGLASLVTLLVLRFVSPRLPGALIVVSVGIAVSSWLGLDSHGVAVVGTVPSGLPDVALPSPAFGDAAQLAPAAIGIFLVALADGILTARSFAGKHNEHVDPSQELLALGAANVTAGLTRGFPVGVSVSRTAANDEMGSRSQISGLVAAGAIALTLLFLTGPIADLPTPVLGAVIVMAALGLVDIAAWRTLASTDRVELTIAAVTTAGVLIVGVLPAIAFAVGLSIVDVVRRSARPHDAVLGWVPELGRYGDVSVHRDAELTPGVVVYRVDDRLFFANAGYVKGRVREALRGAPTTPRCLVLDAEGLDHVDTAGLEAIRDLSSTLRKEGVTLTVARLKSYLRRRLDEAGVSEVIGDENFHPTVHAAVAACRDD